MWHHHYRIFWVLAVVNRTHPFDPTRYVPSVLSEERSKYEKHIRDEIGRAIIDIRSANKQGLAKKRKEQDAENETTNEETSD